AWLGRAPARGGLRRADRLLATVEAIKVQRDRIVAELRRRGLTGADSDANFVLFGGLGDSTPGWRGGLAHGVLLRDVGLAGWLRVTAGTPEETDAFLAALDRSL